MAEEVINNNLTDNTANVSTVNQAQSAITNQENTTGATTTAAQNVIGNYSQTAVTDGVGTMNDFKTSQYQKYATQMGDMYNQAFQNTQNQYNQAYQQNVDSYNQQKEEGIKSYQEQANQYGAQAAISNKNNNMYNQYNGVNTGSASQQALSQSNAYNAGMNEIQTARADFEANVAKAIADMETEYRNNLATALSEGQFELAQQIYSLMQNEDTYRQQLAVEWANNGDFSLLEELGLYSATALDNLKLQYGLTGGANSQAILEDLINRGVVSAEYVYNMTGMELCGYTAPVYYSSSSGSGSSSGDGTSTSESQNADDLAWLQSNYTDENGNVSTAVSTEGIVSDSTKSAAEKSSDMIRNSGVLNKLTSDNTSKTSSVGNQSAESKQGSVKNQQIIQSGKLALSGANAKRNTASEAVDTAKRIQQAVSNRIATSKSYRDNGENTKLNGKIQGKLKDIDEQFGSSGAKMIEFAHEDKKNYVEAEDKYTEKDSSKNQLEYNFVSSMRANNVGDDIVSTKLTEIDNQLTKRGTVTRDNALYSDYAQTEDEADPTKQARLTAGYDLIDYITSQLSSDGQPRDYLTDVINEGHSDNTKVKEFNQKLLDLLYEPESMSYFINQTILSRDGVSKDMINGVGISHSDYANIEMAAMLDYDVTATEYFLKSYKNGAYDGMYTDMNGNNITWSAVRTIAGADFGVGSEMEEESAKKLCTMYGINWRNSEAIQDIKDIYADMSAQIYDLSPIQFNYDDSGNMTWSSLKDSPFLHAGSSTPVSELKALAESDPLAYRMACAATLSSICNGWTVSPNGIDSDGKYVDPQNAYDQGMMNYYAPTLLNGGTMEGEYLQNSQASKVAMLELQDLEDNIGSSITGVKESLANLDGFTIWGKSGGNVLNGITAAKTYSAGGGTSVINNAKQTYEDAKQETADWQAEMDGISQQNFYQTAANTFRDQNVMEDAGIFVPTREVNAEAGADEYVKFLSRFMGGANGTGMDYYIANAYDERDSRLAEIGDETMADDEFNTYSKPSVNGNNALLPYDEDNTYLVSTPSVDKTFSLPEGNNNPYLEAQELDNEKYFEAHKLAIKERNAEKSMTANNIINSGNNNPYLEASTLEEYQSAMPRMTKSYDSITLPSGNNNPLLESNALESEKNYQARVVNARAQNERSAREATRNKAASAMVANDNIENPYYISDAHSQIASSLPKMQATSTAKTTSTTTETPTVDDYRTYADKIASSGNNNPLVDAKEVEDYQKAMPNLRNTRANLISQMMQDVMYNGGKNINSLKQALIDSGMTAKEVQKVMEMYIY